MVVLTIRHAIRRANRRTFAIFTFCLIFLAIVQFLWRSNDKQGNEGCLFDDRSVHRLAVIIPFRDRFRELQLLLPHLHQFLNRQNVPHSFYIVHQVDDLRFNRGALLNVGFIESARVEQQSNHPVPGAEQNCFLPTDYVALHDVDLMPVDPRIKYTWPGDRGPYHPIPAPFHPRYYWYKKYFGGVVLIRRDQYAHVNGMSNSFWGWGSEDDEFRNRIIKAGYVISNPSHLPLGQKAFRSIHDEKRHPRDLKTYYDPRMRRLVSKLHGGLRTANYTLISRELFEVDGIPAMMINVRLMCNMPEELCQSRPVRLSSPGQTTIKIDR